VQLKERHPKTDSSFFIPKTRSIIITPIFSVLLNHVEPSTGENYTMWSVIIFTLHLILLGLLNQEGWGGRII
jgi:hypothetical protein